MEYVLAQQALTISKMLARSAQSRAAAAQNYADR
jgi:hypothetical protein